MLFVYAEQDLVVVAEVEVVVEHWFLRARSAQEVGAMAKMDLTAYRET